MSASGLVPLLGLGIEQLNSIALCKVRFYVCIYLYVFN